MSFAVQLDRIEGALCVLLFEGQELSVPTAWLPDDAQEGASLRVELQPDPEADARLRAEVEARLARLRARDSGEEEITP